jgi:hypothetical protein
MSVAIAPIIEHEYAFFCEEYASYNDVLELICEAYQETGSGKLPPSFHGLIASVSYVYPYELAHRALSKDDVLLYGSFKDDIENALESGKAEDLDDYIEQLKTGGQTFEIEGKLGRDFMDDIEYTLKTANICYAVVTDEDYETWDEYNNGPLLTKEFTVHNSPIVGVW